jgi:hypothetical protein
MTDGGQPIFRFLTSDLLPLTSLVHHTSSYRSGRPSSLVFSHSLHPQGNEGLDPPTAASLTLCHNQFL